MRDATAIRRVRALYDGEHFGAGYKAILRRCARAGDVLEEGAFWYLVSAAGIPVSEADAFAPIVLAFPAAKHGARSGFSLGRYLRRAIYDDAKEKELPQRATRFRQLLAVRDGERDELGRKLRRLLQQAYQKTEAPVDWGIVGADVLYWGDAVRRRWASDFFAFDPSPSEVTP